MKKYKINNKIKKMSNELSLLVKNRDELLQKIMNDSDGVLINMSMEKLVQKLTELPINSLHDLHDHEKNKRFSIHNSMILRDKIQKINKIRVEELYKLNSKIKDCEINLSLEKVNSLMKFLER